MQDGAGHMFNAISRYDIEANDVAYTSFCDFVHFASLLKRGLSDEKRAHEVDLLITASRPVVTMGAKAHLVLFALDSSRRIENLRHSRGRRIGFEAHNQHAFILRPHIAHLLHAFTITICGFKEAQAKRVDGGNRRGRDRPFSSHHAVRRLLSFFVLQIINDA